MDAFCIFFIDNPKNGRQTSCYSLGQTNNYYILFFFNLTEMAASWSYLRTSVFQFQAFIE